MTTVNVTDMLDKDEPDRDALVDSWFHTLAGPLTADLGTPDREQPAPFATRMWQSTPTAWVHLSAMQRSVKLSIASPEYREYHDAAEIAFGRAR